jgi:hypothetical protein
LAGGSAADWKAFRAYRDRSIRGIQASDSGDKKLIPDATF